MKKDVHMAKFVRQVWKGMKIKERCVTVLVGAKNVTELLKGGPQTPFPRAVLMLDNVM